MFHLPIQQVQDTLKSNLQHGLTEQEIPERIKRYGPNEVTEKKETSLFIIFLRQFKSPIVLLLLCAGAMSFSFGKWADGIAILIVLFINAIIGFFMEYQAARSMKSLKNLTKTYAKVIREGKLKEILVENIVPGDVLYVEAGDVVVADARLYSPSQLQVDESALTGESVPVEKIDVPISENVPLAERKNMLYKGTFVTRGNSRAIVCATGMQTELGNIASMVEGADKSSTPIEKKLQQFSKKLIWITVTLSTVIFLIGIVKGVDIFQMLGTIIAMAVAAIPEGLPIVATLALAYGMIKIAKQQVIVKQLASVETLGGTTIICTDKTGTLTLNKISVNNIVTADYIFSKDNSKTHSYDLLVKASILCNTAHLTKKDDTVQEIGDPLEIGLLRFADSELFNIDEIRNKYKKIKEEPFSSETKVMVTLHQAGHEVVAFAKGAAEELVASCESYLDVEVVKPFSQEQKSAWLNKAEELASEGLKVLAFAYKDTNDKDPRHNKDLVFLGLAGLIDPPREEVPGAIRECQHAGIKIIMITGDHPSTAKNIALKLGIINSPESKVMHGSDMKNFDKLSPLEKEEWRNISVFARVSPKQKLDLVSVLQEDSVNIIAMTGDGVNDAPALKKADIGIAMGQRGTQVAQEVADMVLKNDSFASIVIAIKQGRIIFENIRKFLMFLLSSNLSEILVISIVSVADFSFALVPLQILFINLISDIFPALALGVGEGSRTIMNRAPRNPKDPIMSNKQWLSVIIYAVVIACFTLGSVLFSIQLSETKNYFSHPANILFYTLILCQLIHVFNMGEHKVVFYKSDVFRNKFAWYGVALSLALAIVAYFITPVRAALHLEIINRIDLLTISSFSIGSFIVIQILKKLSLVH